MKKAGSVILGMTLAAALLAGCGSSQSADTAATQAQASGEAVSEAAEEAVSETAEAESAETAAEETTFTVGFDAEFPPYGFMDDNGEYTGFDLDLAQEVCDRNGWTLVKQPIDWDAKDAELESGAIDCIWNGFTMNGREDAYTWSDPYIDNSQVVVVPAGMGIESLADLAGLNVGVQKDSSALAALEGDQKELADTFGNLTQYADYNTAFMDLEQGAVDAVAIDIGVANYQIAGKEDQFTILDERLSSEQYAIGFKLGNTELRDQVQATLYEMAADGTLAEIADKYADYGVPESICLTAQDETADAAEVSEEAASAETAEEAAAEATEEAASAETAEEAAE
ncbi:MAG: amino acid ABC transporter substrate-binding protein [Eubacteriales bacterium]|nr:amino acid ABC transporter substrate-binding protein [Eubacteriales bacterium]